MFSVGRCGYVVISQLGVATSVMSQLVGVATQCHVLSWWV